MDNKVKDMTDIELIATKLLGWRRADKRTTGDFIVFERNDHELLMANPATYEEVFGEYAIDPVENPNWPNPNDYNSIRKIEDALIEQGIFKWEAYKAALVKLAKDKWDSGPRKTLFIKEDVYIRATAAQRIAAAAQVLREVG